MIILLFIIFIVVSCCVVLLSIGVSYYAEKFEASLTTKSAIVGMILLALATSLPELTTAIVTAQDNHPELLLSNILGSNFFNLLILACLQIVFWKRNILSHIPKSYIFSYMSLLVMHIVVFLGLGIIHTTSIWTFIPSLLIIALYFITIKLSPGSDSKTVDSTSRKRSLALFILFAFFLVIAAVILIKNVESISSLYQLSSLFAGSILIGIVTSLPELVSSITLVKRKQYTLVVEAIIGSNILNFFILVIGDFIMFHKSIFAISNSEMFLRYLVFLTIAALLIFIGIFIKAKKTVLKGKITYIISFLVIFSYFLTFFI